MYNEKMIGLLSNELSRVRHRVQLDPICKYYYSNRWTEKKIKLVEQENLNPNQSKPIILKS
jgi:hypothetical protein